MYVVVCGVVVEGGGRWVECDVCCPSLPVVVAELMIHILDTEKTDNL